VPIYGSGWSGSGGVIEFAGLTNGAGGSSARCQSTVAAGVIELLG
jgi:hypothetical protein